MGEAMELGALAKNNPFHLASAKRSNSNLGNSVKVWDDWYFCLCHVPDDGGNYQASLLGMRMG